MYFFFIIVCSRADAVNHVDKPYLPPWHSSSSWISINSALYTQNSCTFKCLKEAQNLRSARERYVGRGWRKPLSWFYENHCLVAMIKRLRGWWHKAGKERIMSLIFNKQIKKNVGYILLCYSLLNFSAFLGNTAWIVSMSGVCFEDIVYTLIINCTTHFS